MKAKTDTQGEHAVEALFLWANRVGSQPQIWRRNVNSAQSSAPPRVNVSAHHAPAEPWLADRDGELGHSRCARPRAQDPPHASGGRGARSNQSGTGDRSKDEGGLQERLAALRRPRRAAVRRVQGHPRLGRDAPAERGVAPGAEPKRPLRVSRRTRERYPRQTTEGIQGPS